MKTILTLCAIASLALGASHEKPKPPWHDISVVAEGHILNPFGYEIPTVTIVLEDPENSVPLARRRVWVITKHAVMANATDLPEKKTVVDLEVGESFKGYSLFDKAIAFRYVDKKGREKEELHKIVQEI
jgi:hypothetical protein